MNKQTKTLAIMGLLTAIALIFGYLERLLPAFPNLPGVKIGLGNTVLLFALYFMKKSQAFILLIAKVTLTGLLFSGISAMMYAFAGGLLSIAAMLSAKKIRGISIIGVSCVGAVFHNIGQVSLAAIIVRTPTLLWYLPVLIVIGAVMGILIGTIAKFVIRNLENAIQNSK